MQIIKTTEELINYRKSTNKTVGFVPTMGALHEGHLSLIKQARKENELVVVSIFVNPTQFLEGEDLDKYPKKMQADTKICELCGVDVLFTPEISTMYTADEVNIKAPNVRGFILEGEVRPGHFDGVLQIVLKLLNLVQANKAYFGKKDAQQLSLIKQMVANFFLPVEIIACETVRENDGLAMSSRNIYLNPTERQEALKISKALREASKCISANTLEVKHLKNVMQEVLTPLEVEYIAFVNREFCKLETVELGNTIILVAARLGSTRLIDNIWL